MVCTWHVTTGITRYAIAAAVTPAELAQLQQTRHIIFLHSNNQYNQLTAA